MTPDFKAITAETELYNFHTHSQFCDGHTTMRHLARASADEGFRHLGFTPHAPVSIESPCNMKEADVDAYLLECDKLRRAYSPTMAVYAGMEIDFISAKEGPHSEVYHRYPLDYRIGSVHFVPNRKGEHIDCDGRPERFAKNLHDRFASDLRYVVERYYGQMGEMIALGGFDIIGHIDKIARNAAYVDPLAEDREWYIKAFMAVAEEAIASGKAIEINTKAYESTGRFFPGCRWWQLFKDCTLVVNSDAHSAERVNSGRAEAVRLMNEVKGT